MCDLLWVLRLLRAGFGFVKRGRSPGTCHSGASALQPWPLLQVCLVAMQFTPVTMLLRDNLAAIRATLGMAPLANISFSVSPITQVNANERRRTT